MKAKTIGSLLFWAFILIKAFGSSLATWSWWWWLLPIVPVGSLLVKAAGL